jgi:hypothetical protein
LKKNFITISHLTSLESLEKHHNLPQYLFIAIFLVFFGQRFHYCANPHRTSFIVITTLVIPREEEVENN